MIKSEDLFETEFRKCVNYALQEFGRKIAQKWVDSLEIYQASFGIDARKLSFCSRITEVEEVLWCYVMRNFKIIYFYNEEKDVLWLVDLWDMRQNPRKLKQRAREIERKNYN